MYISDNINLILVKEKCLKVKMRFIYFLCFFFRIAMAYAYYGISFGVDKLSGSLYLNMFILSMLEIPGSFIAWYFMNR